MVETQHVNTGTPCDLLEYIRYVVEVRGIEMG